MTKTPKIKFYNSVIKGKVPNAENAEIGELFINANAEAPFISTKNSNGEMTKYIDEATIDQKIAESSPTDVYTKEEIDENLTTIAASLNDLNGRFDTKADKTMVNTKAEVDEKLSSLEVKIPILDTEMSDSSTNGVQNKVIKKYVDSTKITKVSELENDSEYIKNRSTSAVRFSGNTTCYRNFQSRYRTDLSGSTYIAGDAYIYSDTYIYGTTHIQKEIEAEGSFAMSADVASGKECLFKTKALMANTIYTEKLAFSSGDTYTWDLPKKSGTIALTSDIQGSGGGGANIVKCYSDGYDALSTHDANTIYLIPKTSTEIGAAYYGDMKLYDNITRIEWESEGFLKIQFCKDIASGTTILVWTDQHGSTHNLDASQDYKGGDFLVIEFPAIQGSDGYDYTCSFQMEDVIESVTFGQDYIPCDNAFTNCTNLKCMYFMYDQSTWFTKMISTEQSEQIDIYISAAGADTLGWSGDNVHIITPKKS